jgi:electron transport complex protein RnfB
MPDDTSPESTSRRDFIAEGARWAAVISLGGALATLCARTARGAAHWQIDPDKCTQCGKCATQCVLTPSAAKCTHAFGLCGYCDLCTGFFQAEPNALNTGAENQLCPTGALRRRYVEDPYFEYTIDADLCLGCAKCVKGCSTFGNGSLQLQIDQQRCAHCNRCSIAAQCPGKAISRVPADRPYLLKTRTRND